MQINVQICEKICQSWVTKLASGAFSPKPANPATSPSLPHSTSSSSWKFWPSKWTGPMQCRIRNWHCLTQTSLSRTKYSLCSGLPENTWLLHISFTLAYLSTFLNCWLHQTKSSSSITTTLNSVRNRSRHKLSKLPRSADPASPTRSMTLLTF